MRSVRVVLCICLGLVAVLAGPGLSAQVPITSAAGCVISETHLSDFLAVLPIVRVGYPPLPETPDLKAIDNSDRDDAFVVEWLAALRATSYELQQDDNAEFSSPDSVYSGTLLRFSRNAQAPGTHFFRVRGINDAGEGPWSVTRGVVVPAPWGIWVIQNDTGGDITFDVYGYQKRTFPTGRSEWEIPSGSYTFRVSARCGSLERSVTVPRYGNTSTYRYFCLHQENNKPSEGSQPSEGWLELEASP
jgi:hypothetical protein